MASDNKADLSWQLQLSEAIFVWLWGLSFDFQFVGIVKDSSFLDEISFVLLLLAITVNTVILFKKPPFRMEAHQIVVFFSVLIFSMSIAKVFIS